MAPVADPLLGVWERTETIRLPSVQDTSTAAHHVSSGEQQLRWRFEETTWQLTQTVVSADTTSAIRPGLIYTSSGRWRWHEATLELLRQSGRWLSRDGLWSDLPREIIALEVVVFGDVARLGRLRPEERGVGGVKKKPEGGWGVARSRRFCVLKRVKKLLAREFLFGDR